MYPTNIHVLISFKQKFIQIDYFLNVLLIKLRHSIILLVYNLANFLRSNDNLLFNRNFD